jgi:hypothetical protein
MRYDINKPFFSFFIIFACGAFAPICTLLIVFLVAKIFALGSLNEIFWPSIDFGGVLFGLTLFLLYIFLLRLPINDYGWVVNGITIIAIVFSFGLSAATIGSGIFNGYLKALLEFDPRLVNKIRGSLMGCSMLTMLIMFALMFWHYMYKISPDRYVFINGKYQRLVGYNLSFVDQIIAYLKTLPIEEKGGLRFKKSHVEWKANGSVKIYPPRN